MTDRRDRLYLVHGEALEWLRRLAPSSIDALVTDPPAGISFMGKTWDHDHGGRQGWVDAFAAIFRECLRALKPGAHGLVWALPRTSHWTATALEDAGFEIRDVGVHLFGSGFPKSHDVSKAIDKMNGAEREVVGPSPYNARRPNPPVSERFKQGGWPSDITLPGSEESARWEGFGTALKPAAENWILVRRPLVGTVAENVLTFGVGGLNIDGCRIEGGKRHPGDYHDAGAVGGGRTTGAFGGSDRAAFDATAGRWPANVVLSHSPECRIVGWRKVKASASATGPTVDGPADSNSFGKRLGGYEPVSYAGPDGLEEVEVWECAPGCAAAMLDAQSGTLQTNAGTVRKHNATIGYHGGGIGSTREIPASSGGASRFFYCAKASRKERGGSKHPTVKALDLMRWLCRLVAPPGGIVLDPFMGSGSTGIAALAEGFRFIGIEREESYFGEAQKRFSEAVDI